MSPNTIHAPAYSAPELELLVTDYVGFQEDESILRLWLENAHHAHAPAALPGRRALHADDAGAGVPAARTLSAVRGRRRPALGREFGVGVLAESRLMSLPASSSPGPQ